MNLATLRVDAVEYRLDRTVLAGRIHALQDQQHRPAVLRIKFFLKILQAFPVGIEDLLGLVLVEFALLIGLVRFEMEMPRSVETERLDKGFQLDPGRFRRLLAHDFRRSGRLVRLSRHLRVYGADAPRQTGSSSAKQSSVTRNMDGVVACARRNGGETSQQDAENCASRNAVTKRGIEAVISPALRTRWIAESSG